MDTKETKDVPSQADASFNIFDSNTWDHKDQMSMKKIYEALLQKATDPKEEADLRFKQNWFLTTLDYSTIHDFLIEHPEFYKEKKRSISSIVHGLNTKAQKKFIENLGDFSLQPEELTNVILSLRQETKEEIDESLIPAEYRNLLAMRAYLSSNKSQMVIKVDFDKDLQDYRGLDKWIKINPQTLNKEEKEKFSELYKICPDLLVQNLGDMFYSTGAEYLEGEKWIESLIQSIPPELSDIQKLAIVDNAIGKKISYSPDHDTEIANTNDERAIWKIISSGYGVCLGIAELEKEILNRLGIKSSIISSDTHAFLKVENIELPCADGSVIKGDTIVDPTWNLASHRFGLRPPTFCITYEQARELDIEPDGTDSYAHRFVCEEIPGAPKIKNATINLDELSLRRVFASVGLARENGEFPTSVYNDLFKTAGKMYESDPNTYFQKMFKITSEICPTFTKAPYESMEFLSSALLGSQNENIRRVVINRVYDKNDKSKSPVLYTYADMGELGESFFVADKEKGSMVAISREEFEKKFDCYDFDLQARNGIRPWKAYYLQNQRVSQEEKDYMKKNAIPNNMAPEKENEGEER